MKSKNKLDAWYPQGEAYKAYQSGFLNARLIVHSDVNRQQIPVEIYFREIDAFPELEQYAISLCEGTVLDIGAGTGCHALALQELGYEVHAMDLLPSSIEIMKERGVEHVIEGDFFELTPRKFDTILLLMNGIGFAGNIKGLKDFLQTAKNWILPDGQLIFDSTDLRVTNPKVTAGIPKTSYYGIVEFRLEFQKKKGEPFKWLFIDPVKLNQLARETGWHCQVVYDDYEGHYLARLRLI